MTLKERMRRARAAYLSDPSRAALRRYLIYKAKTGRWDSRYCRYYGVSADVNEGCRQFITRGYARGLVPTSTKRPTGSGSYHSQRNSRGEGLAVDMGLIESQIGTKFGRDRMVSFQRDEERAKREGRRGRMVELVGPDNNAIILRGRPTNLAEGAPLENQHDNHVHAAFFG